MMTKRQMKEGRRVKVSEGRMGIILRSCSPSPNGKFYGAGGHLIADTSALYDVGTIACVGSTKERALVTWPKHEMGVWVDADHLDVV